jgi:leucyl aminopeptidase
MRLVASPPSALVSAAPLVALLVDAGRSPKLPAGPLFERAAALVARKAFEAGTRKALLLHADERGGPRALLLVGMGEAKDVCTEDWRRAGAIACRRAAELGADRLVVGAAGKLAFDAAALAALGEGAVLASYRYPGKPAEDKPPAEVAVASGVRGAPGVLRVARSVAEGANLARELGDLPGNVATPRHLANTARRLARAPGLRCKVHGKRELVRMKMGGILAVNQGSAQEPFLIELEYAPRGARRTLAIVGKGLTFDTGGISLKPADKMEDMKYDMCGAAAVLGLMQTVAALKPKGVRVIGIIGTTENMPGPAAYKPGDVVKTASGKTIEVINTDAEGRVVLADALFHATKRKPDAIIDLATLTGAVVVALGHETAGLFCTDDGLAAHLLASSERTDERLWRMPTYPEYDELIKSRVADVKNSGGRWAGSCTAARFLFAFTEGHRHAHLDIAGTAWDGRKRDYHLEGGSGFGVRLLYDAVTRWGAR